MRDVYEYAKVIKVAKDSVYKYSDSQKICNRSI
jgi:hypothetical protein